MYLTSQHWQELAQAAQRPARALLPRHCLHLQTQVLMAFARQTVLWPLKVFSRLQSAYIFSER